MRLVRWVQWLSALVMGPRGSGVVLWGCLSILLNRSWSVAELCEVDTCEIACWVLFVIGVVLSRRGVLSGGCDECFSDV